MSETLKWYDHNADNPSWIKALAEVRRRATREGWCYPHVRAIIVSIDQYAEAALGNRNYFLNRPYGIGDRNGRRAVAAAVTGRESLPAAIGRAQRFGRCWETIAL